MVADNDVALVGSATRCDAEVAGTRAHLELCVAVVATSPDLDSKFRTVAADIDRGIIVGAAEKVDVEVGRVGVDGNGQFVAGSAKVDTEIACVTLGVTVCRDVVIMAT